MRQFFVMTWKELLQTSNRARFASQKALLVALVAAVFVMLSYGMLYQRESITFENMAEFGQIFYWVALAILTSVLSLAVLAMASVIVVSEHVHHRLSLLLVTPLGAPSIVGAKAVSVLSTAVTGLILSAPFFMLLRVFGGVDTRMVVEGLAFMLCNVWLYAAIGLFASTRSKKTYGALVWAALIAFAWNIMPAVYALVVGEIMSLSTGGAYVYALSPFPMFLDLVSAIGLGVSVWFHVGANAVLGSIFMAGAFLSFRPTALKLVSGAPPAERRLRMPQIFRGRSKKAGGRGRLFGSLFPPGIVSKELAGRGRWGRFATLGWFAIIYGFIILMAVASGDGPDLLSARDNQILLFAEAAGAFFIISVQASVRVAREKEERTIQLLGLTRLSAMRVLAGKAVALVIEQAPALLLLVGHAIFTGALGVASRTFDLSLVPGLLFGLCYAVCIGFYFSVSARRVVTAVVLTALVWWFGALFGSVVGGIYYEILSPEYVAAGGRVVAASAPEYGAGRLIVALTRGRVAEGAVAYAFILGPTALITLLLVALTVGLSRGKGYGAWLSAASYMAICSLMAVVASLLSTLGVSDRLSSVDDEISFASMMLPAAPLAKAVMGADSVLFTVLVWLGMGVLLGWMVFSTLISFEAQMRRAY